MKDKMNISRGRERDRTARQVCPHRLTGVVSVDWKMGKCKCCRLLTVWHLEDRGSTRLPLALLFTFDTIFTFGLVQIIKIQIKYSQENTRISVHQNGERQTTVIWGGDLLTWFCCALFGLAVAAVQSLYLAKFHVRLSGMPDYQIAGSCILLDPGACPQTATAYFSYVKPHYDVQWDMPSGSEKILEWDRFYVLFILIPHAQHIEDCHDARVTWFLHLYLISGKVKFSLYVIQYPFMRGCGRLEVLLYAFYSWP